MYIFCLFDGTTLIFLFLLLLLSLRELSRQYAEGICLIARTPDNVDLGQP